MVGARTVCSQGISSTLHGDPPFLPERTVSGRAKMLPVGEKWYDQCLRLHRFTIADTRLIQHGTTAFPMACIIQMALAHTV